jgi:hypothetical protein
MSLLAQTRPRRATEIVDAAFRFYRAHASDLLVISALLIGIPALVGALAPDGLQRAIELASRLLYVVCEGATACVVAAALEHDRRLSAAEAFRALGGRAGGIVLLSILGGLMVVFGLVLLIVPGVLAFAWLVVAVPVMAIEGGTSTGALHRARALAKGRILHVLGTLILTHLILLVFSLGAGIALGMASEAFGFAERIATLLLSLIVAAIVPLVGVAMTLLYYDLRIRSDGADVAALADALPTPDPQTV